MKKNISKRLLQVANKAFFGLIVMFLASSAYADVLNISINNPNSALASGYPGPYAKVQINRKSTTQAVITFTSLTSGGYLYLLGTHGAADLNVNGAFTLSRLTEANSLKKFAPTFSKTGSGNISGLGSFNLAITNKGGFHDTATSISFLLTKKQGSWAAAGDVLKANGSGSLAAVHAFACAVTCTYQSGAAVTGYAGSVPTSGGGTGTTTGGLPAVAAPPATPLIAVGLICIVFLYDRRARGQRALGHGETA